MFFKVILLSLFAVLPGSARQLVAGPHFKEPVVLKEKILASDYQATVAYRDLLEKWGQLPLSPLQALSVSHNFIFSAKFRIQVSPTRGNSNQTTQVFAFIPSAIGDALLGHQKVPP